MKISHSKKELYETCPKKYEYKYVQGYYRDETSASLLFGSAIDNALNYVLLCVKKNRPQKPKVAKWLFQRGMDKWYGQNPLLFFKGEQPPGNDNPTQKEVWDHLCTLGPKMIDTYITEILPQFKSIEDVQIRKDIENGEGDTLVLIADFKGVLNDGTVVVADNKTASPSTYKTYTKNSVNTKGQLPLYGEHLNVENGAYIVLEKVLKEGKVNWKIITSKIDESVVASVYDEISEVAGNIKAGVFPKNEKACFKFRQCEYFAMCKYGKMQGILKK